MYFFQTMIEKKHRIELRMIYHFYMLRSMSRRASNDAESRTSPPLQGGNVFVILLEEHEVWTSSCEVDMYVYLHTYNRNAWCSKEFFSSGPGGICFPDHTQYYKSSNIYHYYDFSITRRNEFEHLKKYIKDGNHLRLLNRMNSHDRFAAVLGILPNQLIRLVRETKPEDKDVILRILD